MNENDWVSPCKNLVRMKSKGGQRWEDFRRMLEAGYGLAWSEAGVGNSG